MKSTEKVKLKRGEIMIKWPWRKEKVDSEESGNDPQIILDKAWEMLARLPFQSTRKGRGDRNEQLSEIRKMAEHALTLDPKSADAYVLLGNLAMEEKQYDKMLELFLKALELSDDPDNESTWDGVILCLDDGLKDYPRLAIYLEKFYEKKKEFPVVGYLAWTYLKLNQPAKALAIIDDYLTLFPDDRKAQKLRSEIVAGKRL